ncbi:MAG: M20 family metallopeptidase [Candidatus Hermodarchaeota archaeon]
MNILPEAKELLDKVIQIRRQIHQYPELGFQEYKTSSLIQEHLEKLGVPFKSGIAETGVVAELKTNPSQPKIALRADFDALELQEETGASYASKIPNCMHACGHDAHTAMLLGVAEILSQKELPGNVKFIFQPAEETVIRPDYVGGGAKLMVEAGIMEDVNAVLAVHVFGMQPTGQVTGWQKLVAASCDTFKITIKGKGGHGAAPEKCKDAIVMASQSILALQNIVSRMIEATEPAVVSIGTIHGGSRHNIIFDKVELEGTVRTLSEKVRGEIPVHMKRILQGVADSYEGKFELEYHNLYPVGQNDPKFSSFVHNITRSIVGEENFTLEEKPMMGSEDFWYYAQKAPACFLGVGCLNESKGIIYMNHHPKFDVDEDSMAIGMTILAKTAMKFLEKQNV